MKYEIWKIIIVFVSSWAFCFFLTPLFRKLGKHFSITDRSLRGKPAKGEVPLLGGWALYLPFTFLIFFLIPPSSQRNAFLLGSGLMVLLGFVDDLYDIKPWIKLLFQIGIIAMTIYIGNIEITFVSNPFNTGKYIYINEPFAFLITLLWVVAITNALNLVDGLDGLASGLSIISLIAFLLLGIIMKRSETLLLYITILIGSNIGFLRYNFPPASIFLGDAGSLFLGFTLGIITVLGTFKTATVVSLMVPILILGIPILDTVFAVVRRTIEGKNIFRADTAHIHHRLLDLGFTERQSVDLIYIVSIILNVIAVLFRNINIVILFLLYAIVGTSMFFFLYRGFFKRNKSIVKNNRK